MFYFIFAIFLFTASVMVHIFICRQATKTGLLAKEFIVTAMVFLGVYVAVVVALSYSGVLSPHSLWGMPFKITSGIIFILLVPIYLCFYVLTQLTSPSKKILASVSVRGELARQDIVAAVKKEDFIGTRLKDLCVSGCVAQLKGRYVLTPDGQKLAATLNFMQWVLGRKAGG